MNFIYFIGVIIIGLSCFLKRNQSKVVSLITLGIIILLLSLRSAPDEYLRYIEEYGNIESIISGFPLSEPFFKFFCLIYSKTPIPLFLLYFTTYLSTFYLIIKGLEKSGLSYKSIPLCISFFLAHWFITLGYIAIRGSLANAFCFYGASVLINSRKFLKSSILLILAILIHPQTILLVFVIYTLYIISCRRDLISKIFTYCFRKIYIISPFVILILIFFGDSIKFLNTYFLSSILMDNKRYALYIVQDIYNLSIYKSSGIINVVMQVFLFYTYLIRIKKFNLSIRFYLTISIMSTLILLMFFNFQFIAFRFASGFSLFNLFIIGHTIEKKVFDVPKNTTFSFLYLGFSIILLTYNVILQNRFFNFAF